MKISLKPEEQDLLDKIELEALNVDNGQPTLDNCERAATIASMLFARKAIPEMRLKVFTEADYATGRGPSVRDQFYRNGNTDAQMVRHPHFLAWLRYFIFGPQLPEEFIKVFKVKVEELEPLTSGDVKPLATLTRKLVRDFRLEKSEADEVFKLALEFKDDIYLAKSLRTAARTAGLHYRRR